MQVNSNCLQAIYSSWSTFTLFIGEQVNLPQKLSTLNTILCQDNFDISVFCVQLFDSQTIFTIEKLSHFLEKVAIKLTTWKNINTANEHHSDWTVDSIDLNIVTEMVLFDEEYPEYYQTVSSVSHLYVQCHDLALEIIIILP